MHRNELQIPRELHDSYPRDIALRANTRIFPK